MPLAHLSLLSDLLKRHSTNHTSAEEGSNGIAPATTRRKTLPEIHRPRAERACQACADAKTRCEGDRPCFRYRQKSITCEYPLSRANEYPEYAEAQQLNTAQGNEGQVVAKVLIQNHTVEAAPTFLAHQMAETAADGTINSLESTGAQSVGFQLPTP